MSYSQVSRNVLFGAFAAALLMAAGCSSQPTQQATSPATAPAHAPAKQTSAAKQTSSAKPAGAQAASSKKAAPATKTASTSKSASAKPVSVSSKVTPANTVTVPKGTFISAKITEPLASNKNHAGDSFTATLASSVKVNGKVVIPKGAQLTGHVVTAKKKKPAELTLALASVQMHGKSYALATSPVAPSDTTHASDPDAAKSKKEVAVTADTRMKFKLTKSVKIAVKG